MLTWAHKKVDKKAIDDYRMKKKESSSPRKSKSQEIEIGNEASKSSSVRSIIVCFFSFSINFFHFAVYQKEKNLEFFNFIEIFVKSHLGSRGI